MYIDRLARKEGFHFAASPFSLDPVVARIATGKHLDAIACYLVTTHHFLGHIGDVGNVNGVTCLDLDFRRSVFFGGRLLVGLLFLLLLGRSYCWSRGRRVRCAAVDETVDIRTLLYSDLSFTLVALLYPLCESRLCIGCNDTADTQSQYDNDSFHFLLFPSVDDTLEVSSLQ